MVTPGTAVPPPSLRRASISRTPDGLLIGSAFPTWAHVADAALGAVLLATSLLLAAFAFAAFRGRGSLGATLPLAWPLSGAASLLLAREARRVLHRLRPILVHLGAEGLTIDAPQGAPLTPAEAADGAPRPGGRRSLSLRDLERVEVSADGLVVRGRLKLALFLPWQYQRGGGSRLRPGLGTLVPAFRFDELDWIRALIERLRSGDPGALVDLEGLRRPGDPSPASPVWEKPAFVIPGLGATRLRLWTLLAALLLALAASRATGLLGW